ncbi:MAG: ABC transporter ATP-binding protein [Fimbriimonadaceae bacterium]|nr:ABC transporter ATP-binding protein [Fimbriimonadaceae bacterium]
MTPADTPAPNRRAEIRRVIGLFGPHRAATITMLATVMVGVLLGLAPPFFLQVIIDQGLQKKDIGVIASYSILTIVITLAAAGVTLLYGYQSVVIGQKIMCEIRHRLFTHLQGMSLRFFTSTRTGDIQTRLISDVGGIQNVVSNTLVDAISNVAIVVSAIAAMFWMDWRLTLLAIALVPVFAVFGRWVGDFARDVRQGTQEQTAEINSMMQENLSVSGALLGKTIGRADVLANKFDLENQKLAHWQIKASVLQYVFFAMIRVITQIIPALIYWLAGFLLFRGDTSITVGMLVAFSALQTRMFFPLTGIMATQVELLSSLALFARIFEYLDMPHDIQDSPGARALPVGSVRGEVTFEGVGFKYDQASEDWTLQEVSLSARTGELVALVGPSGAGKTTLTYLIPRLYDVDAGRVLLDGTDIRDIAMEDLKRVVGMVTQETYLVHTTIAENLRIAKPEATDEELIEACRAAAIHDHIAGLPEGYETVVGERGYKLSGGEKQRLAIARAILKNPPILILDEATSALDTTSERLIQNSLNSLMQGRTTFAIAHRLSTIHAADQILVVDGGRIVERGRHTDLLAQGGLYAKLYNEQFLLEQQGAGS